MQTSHQLSTQANQQQMMLPFRLGSLNKITAIYLHAMKTWPYE